MMTCKQATKLMSEQQDRPLKARERISLRMHLLMCAGCANFDRQLKFVRKALHHISGTES